MVDRLTLLRGRQIAINKYVTLLQPRIGQIEEFGEQNFFNTFWTLCSSAWDMPSFFDDLGVDFMTISDWSYFMQFSQGFGYEDTKLIFGDLDFTKLVPCTHDKDGEQQIVLSNPETMQCNGVEWDPLTYLFSEQTYKESIAVVREMIGFVHQGRKAKNRATAKILIQDDRKRKNRKKPSNDSFFFNGIISLVNTEEFSYTYEQAFEELTLYQFTKSLIQIQGKKEACALLQGSMSGFVDTKGIPSKNFQWQYSDEKYKRIGGKTLKDSLAPGDGKLNIKEEK